eukprot:TRINITY_DN7040_c0_g1_i1.p1 TRINITY_DN7040_c0_g1~~TRINITY_DN7040_c0_g1_i1.p1  ORF type:complete len:201 (+),score=46.84 TRINITY_DN7040_c0_g1_i1:284-886(+)
MATTKSSASTLRLSDIIGARIRVIQAEQGNTTLRPAAGINCTLCLEKQGVVSGMYINPWIGSYVFNESLGTLSIDDGVVVTLLNPYTSSQQETMEDRITEILDRIDRFTILDDDNLTISLSSKHDRLLLEPASKNDAMRIKEAQRKREKTTDPTESTSPEIGSPPPSGPAPLSPMPSDETVRKSFLTGGGGDIGRHRNKE